MVLNRAMLADQLHKPRYVRFVVGEAVALLHALFPAANLLAVRLDGDYRAQTRPILELHHKLSVASVAHDYCAESSALLLGVVRCGVVLAAT